MTTSLVPRLKEQYNNQIRMKLKEDLQKSNIMEVPQITKIVVNMGVGEAVTRSSLLEGAISDLSIITGQCPLLIRNSNNSRRKRYANMEIVVSLVIFFSNTSGLKS